jgi:hypothetical protein
LTFQEWFSSKPHRAKYDNDHPAYLAAQEAWQAAHEACAKAVEDYCGAWDDEGYALATAIRARGEK